MSRVLTVKAEDLQPLDVLCDENGGRQHVVKRATVTGENVDVVFYTHQRRWRYAVGQKLWLLDAKFDELDIP